MSSPPERAFAGAGPVDRHPPARYKSRPALGQNQFGQRIQGVRSQRIMVRCQRQRELARRRKRGEQLKKFRVKYAKAKSQGEKETISQKVFRISPFAVLEVAAK